jgi:hypothetical protein
VTASDGTNTDVQTVSVTVTNEYESGPADENDDTSTNTNDDSTSDNNSLPDDESDSTEQDSSDTSNDNDSWDTDDSVDSVVEIPAPTISDLDTEPAVTDPEAENKQEDSKIGSAKPKDMELNIAETTRVKPQAAMDPKYRIEKIDPQWNQQVDIVIKRMEKENKGLIKIGKFTVGSSIIAMGTISVGYITWALYGSALFTSMLSSMPVWMEFDPLPILENFDSKKNSRNQEDDDEVDEKLDTLIK